MVIYQIYPRSFFDSNGDGVGDLRGIVERLEYIASLGVDHIWISPFFKSPQRDFGYDVSDFRAVDPLFGTLDDFRMLVDRARALGLGVLVDMVVSHTSDEHHWFAESRTREGGKTDWYLWADAKADGGPPNNWMSVFGGSAWQWDARRRQYYYHSFLASQPDLNLHHPPVQDQVLSDMRFWLDLGVAGFRLDACGHYFQDPLLRDNPPASDTSKALHPYGFQEHVYDCRRPETFPFLERIRILLDEYGALSIAEIGGNNALDWMGQCVSNTRLHSAYSFDLLRNECGAPYIRRVIETLQGTIPGPHGACYALSNHDKPRVVTRWGEGRNPKAHAKQMLALLACLPGTVCLYQGEELGLPQAEVPFDRLQDPFGKTFWPAFKGRDGCRTPMPWTSEGVAAGFTGAAEPWLPIDERHLPLSVDAQEASGDSILSIARQVFALRRNHRALSEGAIVFLTPDEHVLAFARTEGDSAVVCLFNLSDRARPVPGIVGARTLLHAGLQSRRGQWMLEGSGFGIFAARIAQLPSWPPRHERSRTRTNLRSRVALEVSQNG
jgi:alpha-glucosidase